MGESMKLKKSDIEKYENVERKKLVLYISGQKIKISGNTSYIMIDDEPFQMTHVVKVTSDDLYVPAEEFLKMLKTKLLQINCLFTYCFTFQSDC